MAGGEDARERLQVLAISASPMKLRADVVKLASSYTVLVGRNAAGKSALLRGMKLGATRALGLEAWSGESTSDALVAFDYRGKQHVYWGIATVLEDKEGNFRPAWQEQCTLADAAGSSLVWRSDAGRFSGGVSLVAPWPTSLLGLDSDLVPPILRPVVSCLRRLMEQTTYVPAGLPSDGPRHLFTARRAESGDEPSVLALGPGLGRVVPARVESLVRSLLRWSRDAPDRLDDVRRILSRLEVCRSLVVTSVGAPDDAQFGEIELDGSNLGLASDGTLRALEIVVAIVSAEPGALLMIEEPESGLHPLLVSRLMAEFETVSEHAHLVISTHDPRVVDRVDWQQLRVVQRDGDRITAGQLVSDRRDELKAFLSHEGTLGEFVFGVDDLETEPSEDLRLPTE